MQRPLRLLFLVGVLGSFCAVDSANAHTRSESFSVWEINVSHVDLVMTIPAAEVQRLGGAGQSLSDEMIKRYLTDRIYPIADGRRCPLSPPVQTLRATSGFHKYDFTFECFTSRNLQIHCGAFFDLASSHTNFVQIQNATNGEFTEQLFTNEHQTIDVTGGARSRLNSSGFFEFIYIGIMHIFTGVDHIAFLMGLVLISRRLRDLVFVVTGFTLGHSLTLALAVTGVIRPHAQYIDALVALTIVIIGIENIAVQTRRPSLVALPLVGALLVMAVASWVGFGGLPALLVLGAAMFGGNYLMLTSRLNDAGRIRIAITLVFGLIHGFGFAADLLQIHLQTGRLAELLFGFNLGVEIGQLALVGGAVLLVGLLSRWKLALPRPIVVDVASAFIVGLGVFWFVGRTYS